MSRFIFLTEPRDFFWPVKIQVPGLGAQEFEAQFADLGQDALSAFGSDAGGDADLCRRVLTGWRGVVDEQGAEVAFTSERMEALINRPYARRAIVEAFVGAILGRRDEGNS